MKISDLDFSTTTPEEDTVLESMHTLAENPEQYLKEARVTCDEHLVQSVIRGISLTKEIQHMKNIITFGGDYDSGEVIV